MGSIAVLLQPLSQLLPANGSRWDHRLHPGMEHPSSSSHGRLHLYIRLPDPSPHSRHHVRPHHPLPLDLRGPHAGHVGIPQGQAQGDQDDNHRGRALLFMLAATSPGYLVYVVRPLPAQPHDLRPPHSLSPGGVHQLLPEPHRLRPGV